MGGHAHGQTFMKLHFKQEMKGNDLLFDMGNIHSKSI